MLFLYICAHLANSHWLWGWFCGQGKSGIFSGCAIALHSVLQCVIGLSSFWFLIQHFCLHTEVIEEEVVLQPDTSHHVFLIGNNSFGQNSWCGENVEGEGKFPECWGEKRCKSQRANIRLWSLNIRRQRNRFSAGVKQHSCWFSWNYDSLAEDVFEGCGFYTDRLLSHSDRTIRQLYFKTLWGMKWSFWRSKYSDGTISQ